METKLEEVERFIKLHVYDVVDDHARSRGSAGCDSSVVSVNRWDFVNHDAQQPIAITSQCEDLVTALELYRHHLFSVLLTPELCETLHTDTEDRSRSVRFVERDFATRARHAHKPNGQSGMVQRRAPR